MSLLERVRDPADATSWRRLVDLYTPLIRRWLHQSVAGADQDDLVQEVLGAVLGAMPTFEHSGRPGAFRHWLRTTTGYQMSAFWRSRRSRGDTQPFDWDQLQEELSGVRRCETSP